MSKWVGEIVKNIPSSVVEGGRVRGAVLLTDAEYIVRTGGRDMIPQICKFAQDQGYALDYNLIKPMEWYPIEFRFVSLMAIKTVMQWNDEDMKVMGSKAPKYSLITRLMLRYMVSLDILAANIQKYWHKNYNIGSIKAKNENGSFYLCIKDCPIPRQAFPYLEGYFSSAVGIVIGQKTSIRFEEVRWKHATGECQEFAIKYK